MSTYQIKLLQGKAALITGAAHGIGKVIAEIFGRAGASVVISDINEDDGEAAAKSMRSSGLNVFFYKADLRREEDIKAMISYIVDKFKRLDIVINNARPKLQILPFAESLDEWDLAMDVLLKAVALTSKYALPYLSASRGNIINIASTNAFSVSHQPAAYQVAKAGIVHLTKCLAYEFGPRGIRVNAICPGLVDLYDENKPLTSNPVNKDIIEQIIPLRRAGTAEEIANAALFLCSDFSSYITGHALIIDGGEILGDAFHTGHKAFSKGANKGIK